jgi:hypothetical protein
MQNTETIEFYKNKCEILEREINEKNKIIEAQKQLQVETELIHEQKISSLVKTVSYLQAQLLEK